MLGKDPFYNRTIRKLITGFGTLFNDIKIERRNYLTNNVEQTIKVPLTYKTKQFWYTRLQQDPNAGTVDEKSVAITFPRMGYVMDSFSYDSSRAISPRGRLFSLQLDDYTVLQSTMTPVPYNFNFNLYIMVKHLEDGFSILEQILPYFTPEHTISISEIEGFDVERDIPIVLTGNSQEEIDISMTNSGYFFWELQFKVKAHLYKAISDVKIIRTIENGITITENATEKILESIEPYPLTAFPNDEIDIVRTTDTINIEGELVTGTFDNQTFDQTLFDGNE